MCKKCDIITCAGSGHHLRPDRIEPGAPYFGKSLPVRPLSLPEFLRWCLISRRLWFVVCFGKLSLSDIPIRNSQAASAKRQRDQQRGASGRKQAGWLAGWLTECCSVSQKLGALQTHPSSFLTQRTYSCSNFVAISSLALELLN